MRESPLAAHGSPDVPIPLEPSGQSSRGFGGGGGVGVGVGVGAAAAALGLAATSSFLASASQPEASARSTRADRTFDDLVAIVMAVATLARPCRALQAR